MFAKWKPRGGGKVASRVDEEEVKSKKKSQGLMDLAHKRFPEVLEANQGRIEDIYPCSPIQEGILLTQSKEPGKYATSYMFTISTSAAGAPLTANRLVVAWNVVVQRHQTLRTVFLELTSDVGPFSQPVFGSVSPEFVIHSDPSELAVHMDLPMIGEALPHRFRVALWNQALVCKMEMSHAVVDGVSLEIILQELTLGYEGKLPMVTNRPLLYGDYIPHVIRPLEKKTAVNYWARYLEDMLSCHLKPARRLAPEAKSGLESLQFTLHLDDPQNIAMEKQNVPVAALLQEAWALLLSAYTGQDDVCFGYIVADRDAPVEGVDAAVGASINTLICRLHIERKTPVVDYLKATRDDYTKGSVHQHVSLANVMHSLHSSSSSAQFNSLVSIVHHCDYRNLPSV